MIEWSLGAPFIARSESLCAQAVVSAFGPFSLPLVLREQASWSGFESPSASGENRRNHYPLGLTYKIIELR